MSNKQLAIVIGVTVILSLVLAWTIERTQVRNFLTEFDQWWEGKQLGKSE